MFQRDTITMIKKSGSFFVFVCLQGRRWIRMGGSTSSMNFSSHHSNSWVGGRVEGEEGRVCFRSPFYLSLSREAEASLVCM